MEASTQLSGGGTLVMRRGNIRQESEGNERKHHSHVLEMNKAAVFKWSPTQSVHYSNKAPERSGLPNDRFIQNSSYSVRDLNTSQQCTTNQTTVPSDQRGHICGAVLEHREDNIGQRRGVWGPCLAHRRTFLKPQNTPVTKHTIERVAAQILKRFFLDPWQWIFTKDGGVYVLL